MKKNLLTVLILALLIVNIALSAVLMISVTSTNNKTAALVDTIATVMNLELTTGDGATAEPEVSLADTMVYNVTGPMTMALRPTQDADGNVKKTYMVCDIAFSMNTKHEDYKTYGEAIMAGQYESLIKDAIGNVVANKTEDECRDNRDQLKAEILKAVQDLYGSDFVYKVSISEVKFG